MGARIRKIEVEGQRTQYAYNCPACNEEHVINDTWQFDSNYDMPTIAPSIRLGRPGEAWHCHANIENGHARFHKDSDHAMAGTTVPLPEYPDDGTG